MKPKSEKESRKEATKPKITKGAAQKAPPQRGEIPEELILPVQEAHLLGQKPVDPFAKYRKEFEAMRKKVEKDMFFASFAKASLDALNQKWNFVSASLARMEHWLARLDK